MLFQWLKHYEILDLNKMKSVSISFAFRLEHCSSEWNNIEFDSNVDH